MFGGLCLAAGTGCHGHHGADPERTTISCRPSPEIPVSALVAAEEALVLPGLGEQRVEKDVDYAAG